ncbi:beta-2-glycoprotein 1-like [Protopterus annectens]|uniref:beta-2-glycoprotein 1-like n=1 Tax=Protopterus annectens TaxID=7888 RepID=UPI001CFA943A|nr:beta-2-glycoprotein 1-like [Protopterus annectens]
MRALVIIVLLYEIGLFDYAAAGKVCTKPPTLSGTKLQDKKEVYLSGEKAWYSCPPGYVMRSSSSCSENGLWSAPSIWCELRSCAFPGQLMNGQITVKDLNFQSTINFTCNSGYVLKGSPNSTCQEDETWSKPLPVCELVKCLYPDSIPNGFLGLAPRRHYHYQETLGYACYNDYTLEGPTMITCKETGEWSQKPACKANCVIPTKRGRISYQGKKIWLEDLPEQKVKHNDTFYFYCKDKEKECGMAMLTQCLDGKVTIPSCFKEPSLFTYQFRRSSLPSEIKPC